MEEPWAKATNPYSALPEGDCVSTATEVFHNAFGNNK